MELSPDDDVFRWNLDRSGVYTASSAYGAFFSGREAAPCADDLWSSRAPSRCKVFAWLALRGPCWTANRLSRRGMPHPAHCPFCDQEPETISHLLVGCVFARQIWDIFLRRRRRLDLIPSGQLGLLPWWSGLTFADRRTRRDFATRIVLICWCLWRHRNAIVFERVRPCVSMVAQSIEQEGAAWESAGLFKDRTLVPFVRVRESWNVNE